MCQTASRFFALAVFALTALFTTTGFSQTFAPGLPYSANVGATLVKADFNNDGNPDLVTIAAADAGTVLVSNGDGTFRRQDFNPGINLIQLIGADVNNDGKVDLLGLDSTTHKVAVLLGKGDGTFQVARSFTVGTNPITVAAADFNGDGKIDVATGWADADTTSDAAPNHIAIAYGDGAGNFTVGTTLNNVGSPNPFPGNGCNGYSITKLVASDLNFDGRPDVVFIAGGGGCDVEIGDIYWLRNNGGGSFTGADVSGLSVPRDIQVGDFDQNGPSDLAIPYSGCHTPCSGLNLYLNPGKGGSNGPAVPQPANINDEASFGAPVIADFDNDGRKDLAYPVGGYSYTDSTYHYGVEIARQNPDGTLSEARFLETSGQAPVDLVSGDFNNDGRLDLAGILNGQVTVWLNTTATAQACAPGSDRTVNVCSPSGSSTTPVRFLATPTSKLPISGMKIYVDNQSVFTTTDDRVSTLLNLSAGTHSITVKAWDTTGPFSKSFTLNVSGSGSGTCTAGANRTVHLCSPTDGQPAGNPVRVLATARSDSGINAIQIYIDGSVKYQSPAGVRTLDQSFTLPSGSHRITVKGWDAAGSFSSSATVTVSAVSSACSASANRTVTICSPVNGSTQSNPVHVTAGLRSDSGITAAQIYRDGTVVWQGPAGTSRVDQNLTMSAGSHRITVKGWDSTGSFSQSVSITVR
jgi:hypothetical protein